MNRPGGPSAAVCRDTGWDGCGCESSTFCIQSVEITQHLASMVNTLLRLLRRWPAVEAALARFAGLFTTPPVDEYDRYARAAAGFASPPRPGRAMPTSPASFEMRFMTLHAAGRFEEMWHMLA